MTGPSSIDDLRAEILAKVREYHRLAHQRPPFQAGRSKVHYAGRVFGEEEVVNLVASGLDFWLTMGPYGKAFEQRMRALFHAREFAMVNSGSTANLTAVMAMTARTVVRPLQPGDEVITPAVTFPTTLAPIIHAGLVPVFVDCELGTYNVDPRLVEEAIGPRTRAIMVPHTLGNPVDLDVLTRLAKEHDLVLIEDCCDALGSTWRGKLCGTFGDMATLSFYPAHHITTGEGGGVIVNRPRFAKAVKSVRDWGRDCWCDAGVADSCGIRFQWQLGDLPKGYDHKYIYSNLGYNFKPTDMQAAIGLAQLDRLPQFTAARRENFRRIYDGLSEFKDQLLLPRWSPHADPSWFGFPITVEAGVSRTALVQHLEAALIETRQLFGGNILRQPGYRDIKRRVHGSLEQSDRVMNDTFFIGVYPGLTPPMIDHVIDTFRAFFEGAPSPQGRSR